MLADSSSVKTHIGKPVPSLPHIQALKMIIFYNINQLMRSTVCRQQLMMIKLLTTEKLPENPGNSTLNTDTSSFLQNEVLYESRQFPVSSYGDKNKNNHNWIRSYLLRVDEKSYIFDKILPLQKIRNHEQDPKVSYLVPSEIFTILSPIFLNGLGEYLKMHPCFHEEKLRFQFQQSLCSSQDLIAQNTDQSAQLQTISPKQQLSDQFISQFLKKYRSDPQIKDLLESILKFNYFYISEIAKNPTLRHLTQEQKRGKYTSFFELYREGSEELQEAIIEKITSKESGRYKYNQFTESEQICTPFCIQYQGQYIAILYTVRVKDQGYSKKVKNTELLLALRRKNIKEVLYISTIYVLPKHNGKGHGKNIINILKKQNMVVLLCSSATRQHSELQDHLGTGVFYKKCKFKEFYPFQATPEEECDRGCLLQSVEHEHCSPLECKHPLTKYHDESFYVYDPQNRL